MSELRTKHGDASDGFASAVLGARVSRLDGPVKIRGEAVYALEQRLDHMVHAVIVQSVIAAGRIASIDVAAAKAAPGVLLVLTHDNALLLHEASSMTGAPGAETPYRPLAHDILFNGQLIAAVVAATFEQATAAAGLIRVTYDQTAAVVDLDDPAAGEGTPVERLAAAWGDADAALWSASVRIEHEYRTPREYNLAIEPHGVIASWDGDALTIWEPSQWVDGMARTYAEWFGVPFDKVRLISPYVGGGFGSKAQARSFGAVAAMAAKMLDRPVRLAVTRAQTFTAFGGRPATRQTIAIGATREGRIQSIVHRGSNETSLDATAVEPLGSVTGMMYATPNFSSRQTVVPVATVLPGALRAPGENPSAFGIECAIDELAHEVGLDPLAIRLLNYAEYDHSSNKPWSTRQLREAFAAGAAAFGWSRRSPRPRSMQEGNQLIGYGVAAGTYPVRRTAGEAIVRILDNGRIEVASSSIDMGTGTYTILAQTAADAIGVPVEQVGVTLGDSTLPRAPVSGGSQLANLMTGAVHKAALAARDELIGLAISDPKSPFSGQGANTLVVAGGRVSTAREPGAGVTIAALMQQLGRTRIETLRDTLAEAGLTEADRYRNFTSVSTMRSPTEGDYSLHSWCAHFVEVRVDEDFGTVRVSRMVSALDSGRLYNPKLAESQWQGGIIMGIGQALLEEGIVDRRNARVINNNLGDYLIPTNADIPDLKLISVGVPDHHASALGGKAVGELAIVGVAAAIANAVFHATGKRVRDLPITLEKILS